MDEVDTPIFDWIIADHRITKWFQRLFGHNLRTNLEFGISPVGKFCPLYTAECFEKNKFGVKLKIALQRLLTEWSY